MRKIACMATVLLALAVAAPAHAQDSSDREWATLGVEFGAFSPQTTFQDPSFGASNFETGAALAFSATAWPTERVGLRVKVARSVTSGHNETSEFAPIAVQDPEQWSFTAEVTGRHRIWQDRDVRLAPYLGLGVGMRHYTWQAARHNESKFFTWTAAGGTTLRHSALGPIGVTAEVRAYRSQFEGFGIHGGNWRPGTAAREVENGQDIGFYGGVVDKIWSHDLMFTVGLAYSF